ncbi:hypothetical protein HDU85_003833 [Gaertneriomyces sp. JEL0708]|nr:hypothetical protein HDU85_003833 [Gaertneriomyces sp. JEL0708]
MRITSGGIQDVRPNTGLPEAAVVTSETEELKHSAKRKDHGVTKRNLNKERHGRNGHMAAEHRFAWSDATDGGRGRSPQPRTAPHKNSRKTVRRCSLLPVSSRESAPAESCAKTRPRRRRSLSTTSSRRRSIRPADSSHMHAVTPVATDEMASQEATRRVRTSETPKTGDGWNGFFSVKFGVTSTFVPSIWHENTDDDPKQPKRRVIPRRTVLRKPRSDGRNKPIVNESEHMRKNATVDEERARQLIALLTGATYETLNTTTERVSVVSDASSDAAKRKARNSEGRKTPERARSAEKNRARAGRQTETAGKSSRADSRQKSRDSAGESKAKASLGSKDSDGENSDLEPLPLSTKAGARASRRALSKDARRTTLPPLVSSDDGQIRPISSIEEEAEDKEEASVLLEELERRIASAGRSRAAVASDVTATPVVPVFQMPFQPWGHRKKATEPPVPVTKLTYKTYLDNLLHPNIMLPPFYLPPLRQLLYGPYELQLLDYLLRYYDFKSSDVANPAAL